MSFQAYLDNIEEETELTPRQFMALAHERALDEPSIKAGQIVEWLKEGDSYRLKDRDLGRVPAANTND